MLLIFCWSYDRYCIASGCTEAYLAMPIMLLALQGPLQASGPPRHICLQPFASWEDIISRFRAKFLPVRYQMWIIGEVQLWNQHPDESLIEYICRMQELMQQGIPNASEVEKVARVIRQRHPGSVRIYTAIHTQHWKRSHNSPNAFNSIFLQNKNMCHLHCLNEH